MSDRGRATSRVAPELAGSPPDGPGSTAEIASQAVAEAVMHLVAEGLLPRTPDMVNRLSVLLCIRVTELRDAWRRNDTRGYRPASRVEHHGEYVGRFATSADPSPEHQRASRATKRYQEANPEPGMRRCKRCNEVQPEAAFPIKDHKSGRRRSYDSDCWKAMQRERYLSVKKEKALNAVGITFTLTEADGPLGCLACMDCGVPLKPGDQVHGANVTLRHVDCEEAQIAWLHRRTA